MLRRFVFVIFALFITSGLFAQSGTLQGKVVDKNTGETIPFANVTILESGSVITGGMTDFDGNFTIKPIPAGTYSVKASFVGYSPLQFDGVLVRSDKITFQDFNLSVSAEILPEVEVREYKVPLIDKEGGSSITVTDKDIARMSGRTATAVVATVGGAQTSESGAVNMRGSRSGNTEYYVDGMKVRGSVNIPKSAMSEVNVLQGGVPASYGDVTGGVISITTKGPSREFSGGLELSTSKFLDPYDNNLLAFYANGPLLKIRDRKDTTKTRTLAGYFISGELSHSTGGSAIAGGTYVVKDEVLEKLKANPLRKAATGFGVYNNADTLTASSFENIKTGKNSLSQGINIQGKIDIAPTKDLNITLGGTFDYGKGYGGGLQGDLFNYENRSESQGVNWRAYARLTQKFNNQSAGEEQKSASIIGNAYYTIQVAYEQSKNRSYNSEHKDDLFKYGYVGKFTTYKVPTYAWLDTLEGYKDGIWVMNGFKDTLYDFESSSINEGLSSYTQAYYNLYNETSYQQNKFIVEQNGGILNGRTPESIYGMFSPYGIPGTSYSKSERNQFRVTASGSADIKKHEISLGFEFEQRDDRFFSVSAPSLWTAARGYVNDHIGQLDLENPIKVPGQDTIKYNRKYNADGQYTFDARLREAQGLAVDGTDWIDLDSYDPSELKLDYFSPDELLNNGYGYVGYSGYDAYGNRSKGKTSFEDFFTDTDENGLFTRNIAPFKPTYAAGYIQDKFAFNDLIFRVGVRVDRYDANQMVLKDQYSLYETFKAGDVTEANPKLLNDYSIPGNIGSDYVVYVNDVKDPTAIVGYRSTEGAETVWYDAKGTVINDPSVLNTTSGIAPFLVDPEAKLSVNSFKDYDPQISVMPRISFSFPISEEALFFAYYDVLTQRPRMSSLNILDYYYIHTKGNSTLSNPNARPEQTINYELGFQQTLSSSSSLKMQAFYKEMRDMQNVRMIAGAYPVNYITYDNIDFGTVKGFTLTYDMRRSGNVSLRTSYTLQFANGTGSNASSGSSLVSSGQPNLRTLIPLDYDQRHAISAVIDYRFDGKANGRPYNGPKWFGVDVFANMGANFTINTSSGSPYSKQFNITSLIGGGSTFLDGSINGSRKPWKTTINMRFDKDLVIKWGNGEGNKGKESMMNIYLDVSNLLNTMNILSVYKATGNADDDGYLSAATSQAAISSYNDPEAFRNYYQMLLGYGMYSRPRTIKLGVQLSF